MRMNFIIRTLTESWLVLLESAPYVLFGFFVAGLLKAFVPDSLLRRHLGGTGVWPVIKAALIGIPIPLCSCAVVPAASGLRQGGASKGATAAFLISTPETGVDSIAVNYALLDPIMTVARPIAALLMGAVAGVSINALDAGDAVPTAASNLDAQPTQRGCGCSGNCGIVPPATGDAPETHRPAGPGEAPGFLSRLRSGLGYAFGDMLADVGGWLVLGVLLAGLVAALLPENVMEDLGSGLGAMLLMLAASGPMYVCATASTPLVAALALKGLSPGAAMVFLLAGPATNVASLTVIARMLGLRATAIYLAAIVACSLGFGLAVNALYAALGLDVSHWLAVGGQESASLFPTLCAVLLLGLIGWRRRQSWRGCGIGFSWPHRGKVARPGLPGPSGMDSKPDVR